MNSKTLFGSKSSKIELTAAEKELLMGNDDPAMSLQGQPGDSMAEGGLAGNGGTIRASKRQQ